MIDVWCLGVFALIAAGGVQMAYFARGQTSQGMQIPLVWPYAGIPTFFILAATFALANLIERRGGR
jgi:TRAP-type C4-dicarboxylate transport system permease small subunit